MKVFTSVLFSLLSTAAFSQIGIGTQTPHPSAQLEVNALNKGILIPRVTQANRPGSPGQPEAVNGLMIYQTDVEPGFYTFNGSTWDKMVSKSEIPSNTYFYGVNGYTRYVVLESTVPKMMNFPDINSSADFEVNADKTIFTIKKEGNYLVNFYVSAKPESLNKIYTYQAALFVDPYPKGHAYVRSSDLDYKVQSTSIIRLKEGDKVGLYLAQYNQQTITLVLDDMAQGASLTLVRLN
ncbi:hypothetical protein [Siphonobacter sp. SORGH_AS_1065]|uniref:hypothetical protein n=1 Tax=Siphonobacter sp. SORGH_AS_1065 TaxID=3041795 RepID=UPI002784B43C|nr:hypothetical protein [Siphonobacter sp. SORGH_AS_1065]MDQ1089145.1 hypothetical protein [Siphonobacter sp. SORGH_AS_1065]